MNRRTLYKWLIILGPVLLFFALFYLVKFVFYLSTERHDLEKQGKPRRSAAVYRPPPNPRPA
jgi:hypothetical protein